MDTCLAPPPVGTAVGGCATLLAGTRRLIGTLGRDRTALLEAEHLELVLAPDRPLRIECARGRVVRCVAGCAWITAPGVAADIFLKCGESWPIPGNGRVLVEAVGTAVVAL